LSYLRVLLADVTAVRTWFGAANQAAALAKIYYEALPEPTDGEQHTKAELLTYRPFAIVGLAEEAGAMARKVATGTYTRDFAAIMHIEDDIASGDTDDPNEAWVKFLNNFEAALDGMIALADTSTYIKGIQFEVVGVTRSHRKQSAAEGPHYWGEILVSWPYGEGV